MLLHISIIWVRIDGFNCCVFCSTSDDDLVVIMSIIMMVIIICSCSLTQCQNVNVNVNTKVNVSINVNQRQVILCADRSSKVLHFPHFQFPCATRLHFPGFPLFLLGIAFCCSSYAMLHNSTAIHSVWGSGRQFGWHSAACGQVVHCLFALFALHLLSGKMKRRVGLCRHLDNDVSLILLRWPISATHFVPRTSTGPKQACLWPLASAP